VISSSEVSTYQTYRDYLLAVVDTGMGIGQYECRILDHECVSVVRFFSLCRLDDIIKEMKMIVDDRIGTSCFDGFIDIEEYLST
jgi:hypothetical protein